MLLFSKLIVCQTKNEKVKKTKLQIGLEYHFEAVNGETK